MTPPEPLHYPCSVPTPLSARSMGTRDSHAGCPQGFHADTPITHGQTCTSEGNGCPYGIRLQEEEGGRAEALHAHSWREAKSGDSLNSREKPARTSCPASRTLREAWFAVLCPSQKTAVTQYWAQQIAQSPMHDTGLAAQTPPPPSRHLTLAGTLNTTPGGHSQTRLGPRNLKLGTWPSKRDVEVTIW